MRAKLGFELSLLRVERAERILRFGPARGEGGKLLLRALERGYLRFERGDAAGSVVFAGVELLFEHGGGLGIGAALLAGGDERGDAALQLGAAVDAQAALADEGAALVDLARNAEERFAAACGAQAVHSLAAAGVDGGKAPHGAVCARGVALERNVPQRAGELQRALHRRERPRRIAVLVRKRPALAGGKPIEHGAQKGKQRRLAGFVRRFDDVEPFGKRKRGMRQLAEGRVQTAELHVPHLPFYGLLYYSIGGEICLPSVSENFFAEKDAKK